MPNTGSRELQPALTLAQNAIKTALDEACGVDVHKLDTGELIRIEETLAAASSAAKEAVSVRLRLRTERAKGKPAAGSGSSDSEKPIAHRVFEDIRGKRWHAFAVQTSATTAERADLPDAYREGWLVFESSDEMRRVAPVPAKWEEMTSDELRELCHRAPSSPRRTGPMDPEQAQSKLTS
jgi:hypothetical protein